MQKKIKIKKIKIPEGFQQHPPKPDKIRYYYWFYLDKGYFSQSIVINKHRVLLDGYTTYLLAKMFNIKTLEVMVLNE